MLEETELTSIIEEGEFSIGVMLEIKFKSSNCQSLTSHRYPRSCTNSTNQRIERNSFPFVILTYRERERESELSRSISLDLKYLIGSSLRVA